MNDVVIHSILHWVTVPMSYVFSVTLFSLTGCDHLTTRLVTTSPALLLLRLSVVFLLRGLSGRGVWKSGSNGLLLLIRLLYHIARAMSSFFFHFDYFLLKFH